MNATQIRGEVRYHVAYAGYVAAVLDTEQKRTGVTVLVVVPLGYAELSVVSSRGGARRAEVMPA
ncbi:hypothetical protein PU560_10145 [Georgenia sp. 10Sc9-8]|uniref:Uncharacterized protein n=1 Tax=Georgenia halotolerans TaxID=3028317 RepID=A0ABT5TXM6_9MICO|nr:hypothetical protein [Georgenia halotolerans]